MVLGGGLPEFTYSGSYTQVDDGIESGVWKYAFTGNGTLTLEKKIRLATIELQGGGGSGGASNGTYPGSDGQDGTISSLSQALLPGTYDLVIGTGGSTPYNRSGYAGTATSFGGILSAPGGAGGAYAGNNRNQTHASIYGDYGKGALGGTKGQYSGNVTSKWVFTASTTAYMYSEPSSINGQNMGTVSAGQTVYLASNTTYPSTDGSGGSWYKTESGYYIGASQGTAQYTTISDTRSWYGNPGNAGVILLSGKV